MYAFSVPSSPQRQALPTLHFSLLHWMVSLLAAVLLMLVGLAAHAAPPPAGTVLTNQASLSYVDSGSVTRTVQSNIVQTTVLQVAALTLTANGGANLGALNGTPGSIVYFPHTLTNTGNGTDTFNLTAPSPGTGGFDMTNVLIYADNGSGAPTGSPITVSPSLGIGGTFKFIVAATLPGIATAGQTNAITVTAASALTPATNVVNTDTTTVVAGANITLSKAISATTGAAGSGPYTYTITYNNKGNSTATAVAITDALPAGMAYVAGSARWSVTGTTALSDSGGSTGSSPNTIASSYNGTDTLLFTLSQVTTGGSGTLTFQVNVPAGTAAGVKNNVATAAYGPGTLTATSNTVGFTVTATSGVVFETIGSTTTVATAPAGSAVNFTNVFKNTGTATDTFNMSIVSNSFPTGTSIELFRADGVTLLSDSNNDGKIDTGPVAANTTVTVILKATLPANAPTSATAVSVIKRATSVNDPTKTADATDTLSAVVGATVDLTNDQVNPTTGTLGAGTTTAGEAAPQKTNTVNPGATTTFTLVVKNGGTATDTYDLGVNTAGNFGSATLPAGWGVTFKAATGTGLTFCSTTGATVVNTGSIAVGANAVFCAEVTVPAGFAPGDTDLFFRALSPSSAASDVIRDRVTVNAVRSLSISPPTGTNQTSPGGTVVYAHTLTNTGNANEGNGTQSTVTLGLANTQSGWTSTVHYDADGNGVIDPTETPITTLPAGLAPSATMRLLVRVNAPSGATAGQVNITTVTATTTNGTYTTTVPAVVSATDTTTIVSGNLQLVKTQAIDAACDGTPDAAYAQTGLLARPGQCVMYQITVTNAGSTSATNVVVTDGTPTFTTMSTFVPTITAPGTTVTAPAAASTGTVATAPFTLTASQSSVLTFGVKIDN